MGSHGDTVLDSGGPLPVQPNCAAALLFSQQEAHAILPPRSGCVRARCELFGRSQLWPKKPTFKQKTGRSESGQFQKSARAKAMSAFPPFATRQRTSLEVRLVPIAIVSIAIGRPRS